MQDWMILVACKLQTQSLCSPCPCSNYCKFEDWVIPIFDAMLKEQQEQGVLWTPSKVGRGMIVALRASAACFQHC